MKNQTVFELLRIFDFLKKRNGKLSFAAYLNFFNLFYLKISIYIDIENNTFLHKFSRVYRGIPLSVSVPLPLHSMEWLATLSRESYRDLGLSPVLWENSKIVTASSKLNFNGKFRNCFCFWPKFCHIIKENIR